MRILLAVDGSPGSAAALWSVAERTWPPGVVVRVLGWAEDGPRLVAGVLVDVPVSGREENDAVTAEAAEILKRAGLSAEIATGHGNPSMAIIEQAARWDADWIVLGANEDSSLVLWLDEGVILSVVKHAQCSVEVIRKKPREAEALDFDLEAQEPLVESATAAVVQMPAAG